MGHTVGHFGLPRIAGYDVVRVICLAISTLASIGTASTEESDALARAREAALAVREGIKTGFGEGIYRAYDENEKLMHHCHFSGVFDGARYYLKLSYRPLEPGVAPHDEKRIVVCDGSELFAARFLKQGDLTRAEGQIFHGSGMLSSATEGFDYEMKEMIGGILPVDDLDKYEVRMEKLPNGHYRGTYEEHPKSRRVFEIAPEYGYHAVLQQVFGGENLESWGTFTASWDKDGEMWFVKRLTDEVFLEGKFFRRWEIEFEKFQANVPVSGELFTLKALELPAGSRLIDYRVPPKADIHQMAETEDTAAKRADRLIEQVEAMPKMSEAGESQRN